MFLRSRVPVEVTGDHNASPRSRDHFVLAMYAAVIPLRLYLRNKYLSCLRGASVGHRSAQLRVELVEAGEVLVGLGEGGDAGVGV
jgi:hypothetical protein